MAARRLISNVRKQSNGPRPRSGLGPQRVAVCGAGGAIGGHLVARLLTEGHEVVASDVKAERDWWQFVDGARNLPRCDLRDPFNAEAAVDGCEWVFDLAEDMGGIGFITAERVACAESVEIGIRLLRASAAAGVGRFFFASSACAYPTGLQVQEAPVALREDMAWPAQPEEGYGFAKLYMEQLCRFYRAEGLLDTRVARYHNVYGPHSSWAGGREKSPAALARKVVEAPDGGQIEVWGDGRQTRSYCYVDDCVEGTLRLMASSYPEPMNIGSERSVSINTLARMLIRISGKRLSVGHVNGPQGVRGRTADLSLARTVLGWEPRTPLEDGLDRLYSWVSAQSSAALTCDRIAAG